MTAKEAREKAEINLFNKTDGQYSTIIKKIHAAIDKGEFKITIYETLIPFLKERLEGDGFNVEEYSGDPRGENSTTISW